MGRLFGAIGRGLKQLTGSLSWTPPPWAAAAARLRRERPKRFWGALLLLTALLAGAVAGYRYYRNLPQPLLLVIRAEAPRLTPNVEQPRPEPLRITFDYDRGRLRPGEEVPGEPPSVARLELIDRPVETGIRLDPALAGNWRWEGDRTLVFLPGREWPAGTRFQVVFDPRLFLSEARFASYSAEFTSPPFTIALDKLDFHQDPRDRQIRKGVATLRCSHPVDKESLERRLSLTMRPSGQGAQAEPEPVAFTVAYDKNQREAYVHTAPLPLPDHPNYLRLAVAPGVLPATGGAPSAGEASQQLLIPDRFSFLKVERVAARIVRNAKDEPEQILTLSFNDDIAEAELADKLQVWLLPERNPKNRSRFWSGPQEVTEAVLRDATPLTLVPLETELGFARDFHLPFDLPPRRTLYVRLKPGLTSLGRFTHATFYDALAVAPDYPQEIKIAGDGALLSLAGSHQLGLMSRGLSAFRARIGKVLPGQLQHLVSQTGGDLRDPQFENYRFGQDNIVEYAERIIDLKPLHPKQANFASVDLSPYLPTGDDRFGLFFVELSGWDPQKKRQLGSARDRRLILVTDLGLLVKDNADGSRELFVMALGSGRPVAEARVELLGRNGLPLLTRATDAQGHAAFPALQGFRNERQPNVYLVKKAGDTAFLPFERPSRQLNFSRFETGGVRDRRDGRRLNAFLFSDRGLYRPGEEVAIGAIVKSEPLGNVEGIPVEIAIRNPRGAAVGGKRLMLPPKGFFDFIHPTAAASETGAYQVDLYLVRDGGRRDQVIGSTEFRVEEFLPDTLKIRSTLVGVQEPGWYSGASLTSRVRLENLFGTPAQGRKVIARMRVRSARFRFKEHQGFTFADPWFDPKTPPLQADETLPAAATDAKGEAEFLLPLDRFARGTYQLTLTTEGFEPGGGRSVTARNSVLVSPLKTLVGTRPDGPLEYLNQEAARCIDLIAIGADLKPLELTGLRLRLAELRTLSTLVKLPDGTYAYQSVEKEQELETADFAIAASGARYRLPTSRPGRYLWELLDGQGLKLARARFQVVGHGNLLAKLEKNAELELKLNRTDYQAGAAIEMNITAPYTGSGLITIESDRVHAWKWFTTDTTSALQTIAVPPELEGNAYVNVAFVRHPASPEIFTSPLSYAVASFSIDRARRAFDLRLEAPAKVRPGERLEIGFQVSRPAKAALFAVDEGILQAAGYRTPRPLDHFLQKRALQVGTLQMLDLILPEFDLIRKLSASGGGMADETQRKALAANLNPFARALEKPAVFWSGIVDAGSDRRTVGFTVPESFSGTLRIMAVAVAEEAIGIGESASLVRGPFVITPVLPTQAAPGDSFRASAGISNLLEGSGADAPVTVEVEPSPHLEVIGDRKQQLTIGEGSEKTVHFQLRAQDRLGAASLRLTAASGNERSRRTATLSIRPALPYATTLSAGFDSGGKAELAVPRRLYGDLAEQRVAASASPLVMIEGLSSYLEHFPHGCTEQVVSQVFPLVGLMSHPAFASLAGDLRERFAVLVARLRERQRADGGFSFWPGGGTAAEFPTVYALHFLLEAKELGFAIPDQLLERGQDYLRRYVQQTPADLEQARVRAYAIYLLTRLGKVTANYLVHLQDWLEKHRRENWRQDLAAAYMAAAYALLKKEDEAAALIGRYRLGEAESGKDGVFHSVLTRDAQFVYLLARHFPRQASRLQGAELLPLVEPVFRGRYNTISAAYTILALGAYGRLVPETGGPEEIRFSEVDAVNQARELKEERRPWPQAVFGVEAAKILVAGGRPLFHLLSQAGFDRRLPTAPVRAGLEISREFLGRDGAAVTRIGQGEEVTVRLRMRALGAPVDQVAVIDLLPGGFEVQRDSVPREAGPWRADYVDVREDRVIFYGHFDTSPRELSYRAKATAAGEFTAPPPWAEAMYDRAVRAAGLPGRVTVTPEP